MAFAMVLHAAPLEMFVLCCLFIETDDEPLILRDDAIVDRPDLVLKTGDDDSNPLAFNCFPVCGSFLVSL